MVRSSIDEDCELGPVEVMCKGTLVGVQQFTYASFESQRCALSHFLKLLLSCNGVSRLAIFDPTFHYVSRPGWLKRLAAVFIMYKKTGLDTVKNFNNKGSVKVVKASCKTRRGMSQFRPPSEAVVK